MNILGLIELHQPQDGYFGAIMSIYQKFAHEEIDENGALVSIDITWPDNFNFAYDVVDETARETPDKLALVWRNTEGEEHFFTFEDIRRESVKAANVFLNAGIKKGDKVMVALKRHYEYWFIAVALCRIGAVMIPVTHMLTASDFAYRFDAARPAAIIVTPQSGVTDCVLEAVKGRDCPILWTVQQDREHFRNLSAEMQGQSDQLERIQTKAEDPMLLYFTSGTTGYPKGVIHDFTYPLSHIVTARWWQQAEDGGLHFTVAETGWAKASWGKIYGQWLTGCAVMAFDFDNFEPKQLASIINQYKVTSFCAPPTVYRYLVRKGVPDMPSLKSAATAGEFLSPDIFHKFQERTGLILHEGYGQTETSLVAANYKGQKAVDGSMGRPSPLYDVRLVNSDGSPTEPGEIGEIVILPKNGRKPLGIFAGYLDNPDLYAHVWRGGVYHTGDAAWQDENGCLWFHSRFDDIIKSGGFRIGPYEIENILINHPAVFECSVVGVEDPLRGQAIKAFIVLEKGYEGSRELEKEIRDFCNSKLAEYKWIRLIEFVDELPKTISGKIRKARLREQEAEKTEERK